jgi:hypothetical protein
VARDIPQRFVLPLEHLASVAQTDYEKLRDQLSGDAYLATGGALYEVVKGALSGLSDSDARQLSVYLHTMANWSINSKMKSIGSILDEMVLAGNLPLDEEKRQTARHRVAELIALNSLQMFALTSTAYTRHEKIMTETSISVDARPVFNDENSLLAFTFWSTLAVTYDGADSESHILEVVLDKSDLLELRDQIDKSLEELLAVENQMKSAGIRIWTAVDDEEVSKEVSK